MLKSHSEHKLKSSTSSRLESKIFNRSMWANTCEWWRTGRDNILQCTKQPMLATASFYISYRDFSMQKLLTLTCSGVGELLGEDCRTFLSPGCAVQSGHTNFSIFFTWSGVKLMQDGWNLHAVKDIVQLCITLWTLKRYTNTRLDSTSFVTK